MKKTNRGIVFVFLGIALLVTGFILLKLFPDPLGFLRTLPYVCIGFGCGIFGHGVGDCVAKRAYKKNTVLARQMEIEAADERNIMLANCAKSKAFDLMTYVFGALMVSLALMEVDLSALLLLIAAYLFVEGYGIYYRYKLEKEM